MIKFEDGKIKTQLGDVSFFERVWRKWGNYSEGEVSALSENITTEQLTEDFLKDGFLFLSNTFFVPGEVIVLIKTGHKEWVIEDASDQEMQEFVDLVGGDPDEEECYLEEE